MSFTACPVCQSSFERPAHLSTHLAHMHPNVMVSEDTTKREMRFCPVSSCPCYFHSQARLEFHFMSAHNGRIFRPNGDEVDILKCPVPGCGKKYFKKSGLYRHTKIEHPEATLRQHEIRAQQERSRNVPCLSSPSSSKSRNLGRFQGQHIKSIPSCSTQLTTVHHHEDNSMSLGRSERRSNAKGEKRSQTTSKGQRSFYETLPTYEGSLVQRRFEDDVWGSFRQRSSQEFADELDEAIASSAGHSAESKSMVQERLEYNNETLPVYKGSLMQRKFEDDVWGSFKQRSSQEFADELDQAIGSSRSRRTGHASK